MTHPLMPKATAVWLVENTALSFEQIADFCGLHSLEVQAIADDEVAIGMQGLDPISAGELTLDEVERCQADPASRLNPAENRTPVAKKKGARYTPVSKRQDRPDAISWLVKNYPEISDAQISRLIGTTKPTINSIRERTHWNITNIKAQNPVSLGLCSAENLEKSVAISRARNGTTHVPKKSQTEDGPAPSIPVANIAAPESKPIPTVETVFVKKLLTPEEETLTIEQNTDRNPIAMPAPEED